MSLSGNGLQSSTGSQCSSKSHSPAGSLTSTMTLITKQERSATPLSGSEGSDTERAKVTTILIMNHFAIWILNNMHIVSVILCPKNLEMPHCQDCLLPNKIIFFFRK